LRRLEFESSGELQSTLYISPNNAPSISMHYCHKIPQELGIQVIQPCSYTPYADDLHLGYFSCDRLTLKMLCLASPFGVSGIELPDLTLVRM
jgi:hypothetical protein